MASFVFKETSSESYTSTSHILYVSLFQFSKYVFRLYMAPKTVAGSISSCFLGVWELGLFP